MRSLLQRVELELIILSYFVVSLCSAWLIYSRWLMYVSNPADDMASSGMYAFGDELLTWFILCLFIVPTALLLHHLASRECFTTYARWLVAASFTAPLSWITLYIANSFNWSLLTDISLMRIWRSPFILAVIGISRFFARSTDAKRFAGRAFAIEAGAMAVTIALFVISVATGRR